MKLLGTRKGGRDPDKKYGSGGRCRLQSSLLYIVKVITGFFCYVTF